MPFNLESGTVKRQSKSCTEVFRGGSCETKDNNINTIKSYLPLTCVTMAHLQEYDFGRKMYKLNKNKLFKDKEIPLNPTFIYLI